MPQWGFSTVRRIECDRLISLAWECAFRPRAEAGNNSLDLDGTGDVDVGELEGVEERALGALGAAEALRLGVFPVARLRLGLEGELAVLNLGRVRRAAVVSVQMQQARGAGHAVLAGGGGDGLARGLRAGEGKGEALGRTGEALGEA